MSGPEAGAPTPSAADGPASAPGPGESWTVLRLIRWSGQYLEHKGMEGGRRDAEHLLARALGMQRLELYLQFDRPLTPEELADYKPLLLRRGAREPLQYILGRTSFRELELITDRRALIPRPETEVLVEAVLDRVRERAAEQAEWSALDVGTGTGAVALSLVREGPFRRVVATDRSPDALALARENAEAVGLAARVDLRQGSDFEPLEPDETVDVVVSNPPYVAAGDLAGLQPEIRDWEPEEALVAGEDGLSVLRSLVEGAPRHLRDAGLLALEVGDGQAERVAALIRETGAFDEPSIRRDLAGRERILLAVRR